MYNFVEFFLLWWKWRCLAIGVDHQWPGVASLFDVFFSFCVWLIFFCFCCIFLLSSFLYFPIFFHFPAVHHEGHPPETVFSSGVVLTEEQQQRYNAIMMAFGGGADATFVHVLSSSDIEFNYSVSLFLNFNFFVLF